jgi:hypothetical protein
MLVSSASRPLLHFTCRDAIVLERQSDSGWTPLRDDRPQPVETAMYYVDERFVAPTVFVGCGASACVRLESPLFLARAVEYVAIGSAEAPEGMGVEPGTSVPLIESRPVYGHVRARIRYSSDAGCSTSHDGQAEFAIDGIEGVCCDVGDEGCASRPARGGWAIDKQACRGWLSGAEAYYQPLIDGYGCPTLVENTSLCCGCEDAGVH